ncbi:hypothetical protein [uncultured Pantoea sp.]|uniref:hypothetical protein n=1 Tax=uncultured Pantoea sp. TaxID=218084 RepID=UPI0025CF3BC8|nr:hypothetical protein [uncultured Pantoea sp.]
MNKLLTPSEYFMFVERFDHYFPQGIEFHSILQQFMFKLEEIVVFHQFVLNTFKYNESAISKRYEKVNILDEEQKSKLTEEESESYHYWFMRHMENINHYDSLNKAAAYVANDSVVINIWAMIEQFMSKGLACLISKKEGIELSEVNIPYRWDKIRNKFLLYNIEFSSLPSFNEINECRVLNNKIKHLNIVDAELESYPSFSGKLGKSLTGMQYPLQNYVLASHHFIGMLLEESSKQ